MPPWIDDVDYNASFSGRWRLDYEDEHSLVKIIFVTNHLLHLVYHRIKQIGKYPISKDLFGWKGTTIIISRNGKSVIVVLFSMLRLLSKFI